MAKTDASDIPGVIAWPPALFLGSIAIGVALHVAAPVHVALPAWPARSVGGALIVLAGATALWAERIMHAIGTNVHPWKPALALATTGPYRFSRNPMYLALCLVHLGIGLLINGVWPVAMTAILFAVLWWGVIVREERYLERRFGETYRAYRRSVRRWI